ncbi:SUMO-interacting motif-containing protein 1 isoform X2 [Anabas testudineus]|uniref:Uncharacterized protein n=1 Tax=Anabas testudineus TaxID=64144 RepID=A0A3Q1HQZ1_ANATE|nr:SUMO-interacting motif-containing protein 1 isoform X2 [Anabas testudineus]
MADVISVSSDDDSDVEILGSYNNVRTKADPLPLAAVRVDVDVVNANVPLRYIDLTDPKWTLPELKIRKRLNSTPAVVDLTESDSANGTELETENLPPDDCEIKQENLNKSQISSKQNFNLEKSSSEHTAVCDPQLDCGNLEPKRRCLNSQTQHQKQTNEAHSSHHTPAVKLKRLPFLENHFRDLEKSKCSVYLTKDCTQMSLCFRQLNNNSEAPECISNVRMTALNGPYMEQSLNKSPPEGVQSESIRMEDNSNEFTNARLHENISQHIHSSANLPLSDKDFSVATLKDHSTCQDKTDDFCSSVFTPSSTSPSSQQKAQGFIQREILSCNTELEADNAESRQSLSQPSFANSPTTRPYSCVPFDLKSLPPSSPVALNHKSHVDPTSTFEHAPVENTTDWQKIRADGALDTPEFLSCSIPSEPPVSGSKTEDMDEGSATGAYRGDLGIDSPVSFLWQEGSDGEDVNEDSRFEMHFRAASTEDIHFVCPLTLKKMMSGPAQTLIDMEDEGFGAPEVLCRQSLSLVYSTIDENYTEGTLQLLSDLLQPGYYPPRDITTHLLHGILLDPQCPYHLCEQAFNLLMRTQRHHMADKNTVPWDWELLTSLMANQEHAKKHRNEVVRMLLEYVVQTLEDDFQAKRSISALPQSIAKAALSCDQKFHQVRDIIKWLFAAIVKSTDYGESKQVAKERDEHIRMVSIFQRMLSLSLEVDRSPTLSSAKLSQELFHMLISNMPLRAHRMLLLESLQSKLLRCKLLEHLLDYACPLKIPLPMSLSLLLHFLKNCTLEPDPMDGTERWQRWEELVHLLWMLLLSYSKAMKGYLCSSVTDQSGKVGMLVYRPDDKVSRSAIHEAVEAFLSRSQADLGQPLPLHVEESLTYLQDHLLGVCQC